MAREFVTEDERKFFFSGKPLPKLYLGYLDYLREVKKVDTGTLQNRKAPVLKFLLKFPRYNQPSKIGQIKPSEVQDYVIEAAMGASKEKRRSVPVALRDFLRFLHFEGFTKTDLSVSVPTLLAHRLSTVPKGMPWSVVESLLKTPNRTKFCGKRDYAIILVFARYGVRSQQLRDLRMSEIDWKKKTIRFRSCKGGKDVVAPLFDDVAHALISYFKAGRNRAPKKYTNVFLTSGVGGSVEFGQRPMAQSTWNIVASALNKVGRTEGAAGLAHKRGPHAIRHAYATALMAKNESMKTIADLLGHKSMSTTFIYTKSSVESLRKITRPWPKSPLTKKEAA